MDASAHKLHTIGVADNAGDTPDSVRANVANAEASAVIQRLLGIRMMDLRLSQNQLLQRMEERMFSIVEEARASISRADLHVALDANLTNALQQIRPGLDYDHASLTERIQAITRAAYESVPADVIDQISIMSAPVNIALDNGQPTSMVRISGVAIDGAVRPVIIDMNHPFWRQNTFGNQSDIEQAIEGLSGSAIGLLTAGVRRTHRFSVIEARDLADANFNIISAPSLAAEETLPVVLVAGAAPVNLRIRVKLMLGDRTGSDAPSGLHNRSISTFSPAELSQLLQFRDATGEFSYWKKYVDAGSNLPNTNDVSGNSLANRVALRLHIASISTRTPSSERIIVGGAPVTLTLDRQALFLGRTTPAAPPGLQSRNIATMTPAEVALVLAFRDGAGRYPYWSRYVMPNAFPPTQFDSRMRMLGSIVSSMITDISRPIGETQTSLTDVARDVSVKHEESRAFLEKLRTGSENPQGAAAAAALAFSDPRILAAVSATNNDAKLTKEINDSQKKLQILQSLQKLRELQISLKVPNLIVPTTTALTAATLDNLEKEASDMRVDMTAVGNGVVPTTIHSHFGNSIPLSTTAAVLAANRNSVLTQMQNYLGQLTDDIASYKKIEGLLQLIRRDAVDADMYTKSGTLRRYITDATGTVDKMQFTSATLPVDLSEEIKKEMSIESEADLKSKIETVEASLKKSKAGGETGDVLQQKIFEEHFKRQGLSAAEAKKSANYMYARSLVDHELNGQISALEEDLFEEHPETGLHRDIIPQGLREGKQARILSRFADSVGLHRGWGTYHWHTLPYSRLVTSYFGLKKLYEGSGPAYINCPGSARIKRNMRAIARALADRHVPMLLNDMGNDLSDEDRKKLSSRKTLSVETLEQFLTGDAPEKYRPRIDHVLHLTDERTDRKRRGVKNAAGYGTNSLKLAAGYTGASVGKAASYTKNSVKLAKDVTWKNRKNIATFGLFAALGGPMGMAAWGIYKSLESGSSKTSSAH